MANTCTQIYIQVVFAVEGRQSLIASEHNDELQKYITGIVSAQRRKLIAINNMPDHLHLLIGEAVGKEVKEFLGGTGNLPVPSGNLPDGMKKRGESSRRRGKITGAPRLPGGSPGRTGRWPVPPRTRIDAGRELERIAHLCRRAPSYWKT